MLGEHCSIVSVQIQEICFLWFCLCLRQTQIKAKLRAVVQSESMERENKGQNSELCPAGAYPERSARQGRPPSGDSWQQNREQSLWGPIFIPPPPAANPTQLASVPWACQEWEADSRAVAPLEIKGHCVEHSHFLPSHPIAASRASFAAPQQDGRRLVPVAVTEVILSFTNCLSSLLSSL